MRTELAVTLVAGLFGLIPVMVQIVSTRAQRRDRAYRLNQLRAELELLERLHTLQGEVSATDEAAKPQADLLIRNSLNKVLDQYNKLSEIAPSTVVGGKKPSPQRLSFFRRAFLLYQPPTTSGWILHTLFYMIGFLLLSMWFLEITGGFRGTMVEHLIYMAVDVVVYGIPLLILQRLARRSAARHAAQIDEPNA